MVAFQHVPATKANEVDNRRDFNETVYGRSNSRIGTMTTTRRITLVSIDDYHKPSSNTPRLLLQPDPGASLEEKV